MFLGPSAGAMRALGDKINSCIVAQSAQLPTLAWSGSGITCDGGIVTEQHYQQAACNTLERGLAAAAKIGYPVMIKARDLNEMSKNSIDIKTKIISNQIIDNFL